MVQLILLGTSCMVPTKERNVTSFYIEYNGEGILFDCGEGTQRQMSVASLPRTKVKKIFISHWHADHVAGLIGLIQTVSNSVKETRIGIYGPKETKMRFKHLMDATYFASRNMQIEVHEIDAPEPKTICDGDGYYIQAANLLHGIPSLGYSFVEKDRRRVHTGKTEKAGIPQGPLLGKVQQGKDITFEGKKYKADDLTYIVKGKKISVIMDTGFTKNAVTLAQDADVLISEATYSDKDVDKSEKHRHMTVLQAAQMAHASGAKKLIMTHFSLRYTNISELEEEARTVFPESYAGYDFMKIKL